MQLTEKSKLLGYYRESFQEYGNDVRAMRFFSKESQQLRFGALARCIGEEESFSVLDVGCGLGDFLFFLKEQLPNRSISYTGIDVVPEFIKQAQVNMPDTNFIHADFAEWAGEQKFDYVVASGLLSYKITDYKAYYFKLIEKMYATCNKAAVFNMLNNKEVLFDEHLIAYNLQEILGHVKTVCPNVIFFNDYLSYDFTVGLLKA